MESRLVSRGAYKGLNPDQQTASSYIDTITPLTVWHYRLPTTFGSNHSTIQAQTSLAAQTNLAPTLQDTQHQPLNINPSTSSPSKMTGDIVLVCLLRIQTRLHNI